MDRDATDLFAEHFALARMETAAYFEAKRSYVITNSARAANRARRPIEGREESIGGAIDFAPTESCEFAPQRCVVLLEQLAPSSIAERERAFRRTG